MSSVDALTHVAKLSVSRPQSHSAILSLKYRDDKKPHGWNGNPRNPIDFEAPKQTV